MTGITALNLGHDITLDKINNKLFKGGEHDSSTKTAYPNKCATITKVKLIFNE